LGGGLYPASSLSLYLMTECQIKLSHSLSRTYDYVKVVARRFAARRFNSSKLLKLWSLDEPLLKLVERKIQKYIMS